jgi:hypothetical protein
MHSQGHAATVVVDVSYDPQYSQLSNLVCTRQFSDILENSLLVALISEAVTRMEYGNVVDVLYIALFEVGRYTETLA